jgi:hypothetical protein
VIRLQQGWANFTADGPDYIFQEFCRARKKANAITLNKKSKVVPVLN